MTRIYESIELTVKNLAGLKKIYASLACTIEIADKRSRQDWMKAILEHQSAKTGCSRIDVTEKVEVSIQVQDLDKQVHVISYSSPVAKEEKTCAACTLFKPFADGTSRGLCRGSDTVCRDHHPQTGDCVSMIEAAENPDTKLPEGSFIFKPVGHAHSYEVWIGDMNYGAIGILENGQWIQSYAPIETQYGTPYAAAAALVKAAQLKDAIRDNLEIISQTDDIFVVRNEKGCQFTVQPHHPEPTKRCDCGDCIYRGILCHHQLAVMPTVIEQVLDKPFDELTSSEWEYLKHHVKRNLGAA